MNLIQACVQLVTVLSFLRCTTATSPSLDLQYINWIYFHTLLKTPRHHLIYIQKKPSEFYLLVNLIAGLHIRSSGFHISTKFSQQNHFKNCQTLPKMHPRRQSTCCKEAPKWALRCQNFSNSSIHSPKRYVGQTKAPVEYYQNAL